MSMTLNTDTLQVGGVNVVSSSGVVLPPSQLKTYTPAVTGSTGILSFSNPVGYYVNWGPFKQLWARCIVSWGNVVSTGTARITLPSSFFSSVLNVQIHVSSGTTVMQSAVYTGGGTSQISFILYTPTGVVMTADSSCTVHATVMGT